MFYLFTKEQMPVLADTLSGIEVYGNTGMVINAIFSTEQRISQLSFGDMLNIYKSYLFYGITLSKIIIGILVYIFLAICLRKIFRKAGRKGRQSLIPIRNIFVLLKIIGKKNWFLFIILPVILIILLMVFRLLMFHRVNGNYATFNSIGYGTIILIYPISLILALVFIILSCLRLAKKFGKPNGFGVGLILLAPIFLGILAFGKVEYIGENNK